MNKKYLIGILIIIIIWWFWWYHYLTSFDNLCSLKTKIANYDHNDNYFISLDWEKIWVQNSWMPERNFIIFSTPSYQKDIQPIISWDRYGFCYGFDKENNFYHTETFEKIESTWPNSQANVRYYSLYKNNKLIETNTAPWDCGFYNKYFDEYSTNWRYIFSSRSFWEISSTLESDGYIYHRSYINIWKLKIKIKNIKKPSINAQWYSDEKNIYTALINDSIYTCNLDKLKWLSRIINNKN